MTREKAHLPSKICLSCNRPFSWRKKWAKVWDQVRYCSKSCGMSRNRRQKANRDDGCADRG